MKIIVSVALLASAVAGFAPSLRGRSSGPSLLAVAPPAARADIESNLTRLKKVLEREYVSFFSPMETEYYLEDVTFDDPLTSLAGVKAYESNVNMLSGKTAMGKILFRDAGIILHNIEGGEVQADGSISNVITRWTLRFTFQILPWQPTARFSGVSVYDVVPGGPKGVQIVKQTDYWDSINLKEGGSYEKMEKTVGLSDFLDQLKPEQFAAPTAGAELLYSLLRRGDGYEVRRYPSFTAVEMPYERRDDGFLELGSFTRGMSPLAPALMSVDESTDRKTMVWPLTFALPGEKTPKEDPKVLAKANDPEWEACEIITFPERVVAVGTFSGFSTEPMVRKTDRSLRTACQRDGLKVVNSSEGVLQFAQYDAIFSMGKRRSEVWLELEDGGHPW